MKKSLFLSFVLGSLVAQSAVASDICEQLQGQLGDPMIAHCAMTGMVSRTLDLGTREQIDCDFPTNDYKGKDLEGYAPASIKLSALKNVKLKILDPVANASMVVADLDVTDSQATLGEFGGLVIRHLCHDGRKSLSCDDLADKLPALEKLSKSVKGLSSDQVQALKTGEYNGRAYDGIWLSFSIRLSELANCSIQ